MQISRSSLILLCYLFVSVPACLYLQLKVLPQWRSASAGGWSHELADAREFARLLQQYDASLEQVVNSRTSPALLAENLPSHLDSLSAQDKSTLFISLVLPNILQVNEEIRANRKKMLKLLGQKSECRRLTAKEQWWLNRLAQRYGCEPEDAEELRLRVDTVPVALALAQAITESGWGTSRFAQVGNALYGQHLAAGSTEQYILSQNGKVKMAAFPSIYDATRSYVNTINRVRAYSDLRRQRAELRSGGQRLSGLELAGQLVRYSEIGSRYVSDLRYLITRYELERFNGVKLTKSSGPRNVRFER